MMCYNKSRKNQMPQSSEAKSYIDDIKLPLKGKPQLEVVKEVTPEVPRKIQKKIAKKLAACISAGIVASTGGFIALGETGHLPKQNQQWYDSTASFIRTIFGIEELKGKPAETITQETKPPEITTPETTAVSTTETTPETTTEVVVNAPEIPGLKFNQEARTYFNEAGIEVGVYVKDALKINGEMQDAIGLKAEVIRTILEKNKKNNIFEVPWPIDLQEYKDISVKEITYLTRPNFPQEMVGTKEFGINIVNPIEILCPSDAINVMENLLQPTKDFPYSTKILLFDAGLKKIEKDKTLVAGFYFAFNSDWDSSSIGFDKNQKNTLEVRVGQLVGKIDPDSFLEAYKRVDWFENAGDYNFVFQVFNLDEDKSIEKKILTLGENHLTAFIMTDNQIPANAQNN